MGQVVKWQTNQKRLEESNGLHDLQRLTKTKEITQFVFCNNTRDFVNVLPNKKRDFGNVCDTHTSASNKGHQLLHFCFCHFF